MAAYLCQGGLIAILGLSPAHAIPLRWPKRRKCWRWLRRKAGLVLSSESLARVHPSSAEDVIFSSFYWLIVFCNEWWLSKRLIELFLIWSSFCVFPLKFGNSPFWRVPEFRKLFQRVLLPLKIPRDQKMFFPTFPLSRNFGFKIFKKLVFVESLKEDYLLRCRVGAFR